MTNARDPRPAVTLDASEGDAAPAPSSPETFVKTSLNALIAGTLIDVLRAADTSLVVVAPGSRSTPLVLALAASDLTTHVAHDERSAGFIALGAARASGRPAAVITTSGTAVGNLYPAVLEAEAEGLPLVTLTADRPRDMVGSGANQTFRQDNVFGDHVACHLDIDTMTPRVRARLDRAFTALTGPVHVNARFCKPLEIEHPEVQAQVHNHVACTPACVLTPDLTAQLRGARRGVVVVGRLLHPGEHAAAQRIVEHLGWPAVTSALSGLRLTPLNAPVVDDIDGVLMSDRFRAAFTPDVVLHLGGPTVSARLSRHLAGTSTIRVGGRDPEDAPAHFIDAPIRAFAPAIAEAVEDAPSSALAGLFASVQNVKVSVPLPIEATVARAACAGDVREVFVGNSGPIRDVDRFAQRTPSGVRLFANRGLSGIDGGLSTAAGIAALQGKTRALVGDIAFLHDAGALSSMRSLPLDVVVIDNRGGRLFERLPIAQRAASSDFERYFITPHEVDIAAVGAAYGVDVRVESADADISADERGAYDAALVEAVNAKLAPRGEGTP